MTRPPLFLALVLVAGAARAEPVTHTFTGTVAAVTNGTNGSLDLTGTFHVAQEFRVDCTIERGTPPFNVTSTQSSYQDPATSLTALVGSFVVSGANTTLAAVVNDQPGPPLGAYDRYVVQADGMLATPVGNASLSSLIIDLADDDAIVFGSTALPREFPPALDFETRSVLFTFYDGTTGAFGSVTGTIGDVTTPALPLSWGALRARYRS